MNALHTTSLLIRSAPNRAPVGENVRETSHEAGQICWAPLGNRNLQNGPEVKCLKLAGGRRRTYEKFQSIGQDICLYMVGDGNSCNCKKDRQGVHHRDRRLGLHSDADDAWDAGVAEIGVRVACLQAGEDQDQQQATPGYPAPQKISLELTRVNHTQPLCQQVSRKDRIHRMVTR